MKTEDNGSLPADVISKDDAIAYASAWQLNHGIKGFLVPLNDFKKITEEKGVDSARVYMGLKEGKEVLMFVGVDSAGNDMIDYDGEEKFYIYDFSSPCPTMCDVNSPLYIQE